MFMFMTGRAFFTYSAYNIDFFFLTALLFGVEFYVIDDCFFSTSFGSIDCEYLSRISRTSFSLPDCLPFLFFDFGTTRFLTGDAEDVFGDCVGA